MRKNLAKQAVVFTLAAALLSGCSSADKAPKESTEENSSEAEQTKGQDDSFELSYDNIEGFISSEEPKTEIPNGYKGIYSVEDLKNVKSNGKYILMADLDLTDASGYSLREFEGILDGNYHVISGSQKYIVSTLSGTIKNLGFENVNAKSAVLADYMKSGSVENCYVTGTIEGASGGLINEIRVRQSNITVSECYNKSNITYEERSNDGIGGIIGVISFEEANGQPAVRIGNCWNYGEITSTTEAVGGIIGYIANGSGGDGYYSDSSLELTVKKCFNYGNLDSGQNAGGIIGNFYVCNASESNRNTYTVEECANYASIKATKSAGGISGEVSTDVNKNHANLLHVNFLNCLNTGEVKYGEKRNTDGGGVIGTNEGFNYRGGYVSVTYCLNIANKSSACKKSSSVGDNLFSCSDYYTTNDLTIGEMKDMEGNLPEFDADIWGISEDFSGFPHPYGCIENEKIGEYRDNKQKEKQAEQMDEILKENSADELIQNQKYTDVLACIDFDGRWPEADPSINYLKDSTNKFDITDINDDGKKELVIQTSQGYMIYTYEQGKNKAVQEVFYEGREESAAFFEEYPAAGDCEWKDIDYENYITYTNAYVESCISKMSEKLDEKKDIGLAYVRNAESGEIENILQNDYGFSFTSDEPDIYTIGSFEGKEVVQINYDSGGCLSYRNEAVGGMTLFGMAPGMSLDEVEEFLLKYGFYKDEKESSEKYYYYRTGESLGNWEIILEVENGRITDVSLYSYCKYVG